MRLLLPAAGFLFLLGCASGDAAFDQDPNVVATDTGELPTELLDGWYSLDGEVEITNGELLRGEIEVGLWGEDVRGRPDLVCAETLELDQPTPIDGPDDDVPLYGMWQVGLALENCIGAPGTVDLGLGPLPRELWPAVEAGGGSMRHARGMYLGDRRNLVSFGFAGTDAQLDGRGAPTTLDPLPDGAYRLHSAFLLPL